MADVQALKTKEEVKAVQDYLIKRYGTHYEDIFILGLNLALRIGDLLNISMDDCKEALRSGYFIIQEQKTAYRTDKETGKKKRTKTPPRVLKLNTHARVVIQSHSKNAKPNSQLSRQAVYDAFRQAGKKINKRLGTHTLRKTMGYHMHKEGLPIEEICKFLNHSHPSMTMKYIGLEQERMDQHYDNFNLGFI